MHPSQKMLLSSVEMVRSLVNDPVTGGKYSNAYLLRYYVGPSMGYVMGRIQLTNEVPVFASYSVTFDKDTRYYKLPPGVGMVIGLRLETTSSESQVISEVDFRPKGFSSTVDGWRLEGAPGALELYLPQNFVINNGVLKLWYVPTWDVHYHEGVGGAFATASGQSALVLDADPTLGSLDRRPGAYVGSVLRIIPTSGPIEEGIITSHTWSSGASAWSVTTRSPFTNVADGSGYVYEIVPPGFQAFSQLAAMHAAWKLASSKKERSSLQESLRVLLADARKTALDMQAATQSREGPGWEKDTIHNEDARGSSGVAVFTL